MSEGVIALVESPADVTSGRFDRWLPDRFCIAGGDCALKITESFSHVAVRGFGRYPSGEGWQLRTRLTPPEYAGGEASSG